MVRHATESHRSLRFAKKGASEGFEVPASSDLPRETTSAVIRCSGASPFLRCGRSQTVLMECVGGMRRYDA